MFGQSFFHFFNRKRIGFECEKNRRESERRWIKCLYYGRMARGQKRCLLLGSVFFVGALSIQFQHEGTVFSVRCSFWGAKMDFNVFFSRDVLARAEEAVFSQFFNLSTLFFSSDNFVGLNYVGVAMPSNPSSQNRFTTFPNNTIMMQCLFTLFGQYSKYLRSIRKFFLSVFLLRVIWTLFLKSLLNSQ